MPQATPRTPISPLATSAHSPLPSISSQNGISSSNVRNIPGQKRKAEEQLPCPHEKTAKRDGAASSPIQRNTLTPKTLPKITPAKPTVTTQFIPYSGTAKPNNASPIPATGPPKPAPKKGSYAEILARAKAAQTSSAHVGVIKHKPKETLSKREKLALQAEATGKSKNKSQDAAIKGRKVTPDSKGGSPAPTAAGGRSRENTLAKPKKPADVGYKGTARALPETMYKGSMNRSGPPNPGVRRREVDDRAYDRSRSASVTKSRYADYTDDDEEEEDEGAVDLDSDLSDMEAGAFDLEEEEQLSSKVARKEDEEELKKELELKRQKEAMKKKLTQMAAAKRRR